MTMKNTVNDSSLGIPGKRILKNINIPAKLSIRTAPARITSGKIDSNIEKGMGPNEPHLDPISV